MKMRKIFPKHTDPTEEFRKICDNAYVYERDENGRLCKTPMKIKMYIDPSSYVDPEHYGYADNTIYCWDWPEKFLAFMPLPELPDNLKEEQHD